MAHTLVVVQVPDPDAFALELRSKLIAFNEQHAGPANTHRIALGIRDNSGEVIAGIYGAVHWNYLFVDLLWVDERYRGKGHGSALLAEAERMAMNHGAEIAYLDTFTFQAPAFYPKCGYSQFGILVDAPRRGFDRIWFMKRLATSDVASHGDRVRPSDR